MFKNEKVGEEILEEMLNNLRLNACEQKTIKLNRRIDALNLLNKAATNLENAGLYKEAEAIVRTMEIAAEEKSPSVKQQVQYLKDYGMPLKPTDTQKSEDNEYMQDPEVAIEVAVDEEGNLEERVPSVDELSAMW